MAKNSENPENLGTSSLSDIVLDVMSGRKHYFASTRKTGHPKDNLDEAQKEKNRNDTNSRNRRNRTPKREI